MRAGPLEAAEFATLMARLGPFEPEPRLAVACSGGADSLALTLLARDWARDRGGGVLAIVLDHGLRQASAGEATLTVARLAGVGIDAVLRRLTLRPGPAIADRARTARYAALTAACAERGILHLLLGHQAADQAETVLMRMLSGSAAGGLAGIAPIVETASVRILRPLLAIAPAQLRASLRAAGLDWVEDPSNADQRSTRVRLRRLRLDVDGDGAATGALVRASGAGALARAAAERAAIRSLASASLRPEGFAVIPPGPLDPLALGWLIRAVGGNSHPPAPARVVGLAAAPRPATLGGVRLMEAGRLGPGLLAVREEAALRAPIPAISGAVWDGRFRLDGIPERWIGLSVGPLGRDAAAVRRGSALPSAVLRTLPALREGERLLSVADVGYRDPEERERFHVVFAPLRPMPSAPFVTA